MGGAWERMIRSERRILNALTQMQTLTEEGLTTLMTEVEGILNSRPLVSLMLHDSEEKPLTYNHLVLMRGNPNLPPGTFDTNSCYTRRRWAQVRFLPINSGDVGPKNISPSFAAAKMIQSLKKFRSRG